jgi:hypothetical protein
MNSVAKLLRLLLLALITAGVGRLSAAYTYQLTSLSQDAIEECYYQGKINGVFVKAVEPGDTIQLPAGEAIWGDPARFNNGIIYIILPITIRGQGDATVIRMHEGGVPYTRGVIALWSKATLADLKIIGAATRPVTAITSYGYNNTAPGGLAYSGGFRVTNVTYEGRGGAGYFLYFSGVHGLIDNCRFFGATGNTELIFGRGPANAWQVDNTLGKEQNIYIEDSEFSGAGYVNDANSDAQMVVRYCRITGPIKVDGHGVASNTPARSYRNMEVYGNTWTPTIPAWTAIEMRGGTFMVFNNQAAYPAWFFLTDYAYLAAWPNFGSQFQTPVNYPIKDQVGVGKDPKVAASEPAYLWNNRAAGAVWPRQLKGIPQGAIDLYRTQTGNPTAVFTERDLIRANRDFFAEAGFDDATGVSTGTKAQMLASQPTLRGVGWWVTDEGEWNSKNGPAPDGQLYTWDGSQWQFKYRPYPYPHPLRGGGAPSNVRINVQVR